MWSDGVPVTADDFIYAWQSQRGDGVDVDGRPDQVASTLGYRDVASVVPSNDGKTVTVTFSTPVHRLAGRCSTTWSRPTSPAWSAGTMDSTPSTRPSTFPPAR